MAAFTCNATAHEAPTLFDQLAGFGFADAEVLSPGHPGVVHQGNIAISRASLYLAASQVVMNGRCSLADAERLALAELSLRYAAVPSTDQKVTREIARFFKFLRATGVECIDDVTEEHTEEFIWRATRRHGRYADVTPTTAANRQSFLRTLFGILGDLGVSTGGEVIGSPIRRNEGQSSRPLTDNELHLVHVQAFGGLLIGRQPLLVAFAEAGGDAAEIAALTADDVDLASGTVRFTGRAARTNPLSTWASEATAHVLKIEQPQPGERLCADNRLPAERATHSITVRLRRILRDAGLAGKRGVTPKSIRLAAALPVLSEQGIEAAARFLGNESLDATARALDHQWWES